MKIFIEDPAGSGRSASLVYVAANVGCTGLLAHQALLSTGFAHWVYVGVALAASALAASDLYRWMRWRRQSS